MDRKDKKLPSDYPPFVIRLTPNEKVELDKLVDDVLAYFNKGRDKDTERAVKKNEVVFEALKIGLPLLKKRRGK